jgi:phosphoserine phosphatase
MEIKAVLIDFDGTIVTEDILDVICGIVDKKEESIKLKEEFFAGKTKGLSSLIKRINFLSGVTTQQIYQKLSKKNYLMKGTKEFFKFLNTKGIISILNSGNLIPILQYYQKKLGISYLVGTKPKMNGNKILSISKEDFSGTNFKLIDSKAILDSLGINQKNTISIGDSPVDKPLFEFAAKAIAINPKNGIEKFADFRIENDLSQAIKIIKNLSKTK